MNPGFVHIKATGSDHLTKKIRLFVNAILLIISSFYFASCGYIYSKERESAYPKTSSPHNFHLLAEPVYYRDKVLVLMYHNVEVHSNHERIITLNKLDQHLSSIKKHGFHMITMDQYLDFILQKKPVPDNAVMLTFDDGYRTFYTNVYPLLRKHGITATDFIVVSTIENPKHRGRTKLSWNQMREMKKAGMSFYNHTYASHAYELVDREGKRLAKPLLSHQIYLKHFNRMETEQEYENRIYNDLLKAEIRLREELGNTRGVLAFPYGSYSLTTLKIARKVGIEVTFTVIKGINTHIQLNGFRIDVGNQKVKTNDLIQMLKNGGKLIIPRL
jgi:biofilm PGA synthesis lipoprotein PgaB